MSDELTTQTLRELARLMCTREVSPVEVMTAHLERIERQNPRLNAVVTLAPDALGAARAAEAALLSGEPCGPLHGVPLTVKDTIETRGLRTTAGSRVRAGFIPEQDAAAVARLRAAGAIVLGKTNVAEMAAAYDTENPLFGHANNPYDLSRTTGGSSGGEAAAIAACLSPGGLGSDLMGSIRVPAHFCGIAGLKATAGSIPVAGHLPRSAGPASLGAAIGPMARKVSDLALLFEVLTEVSPGDAPSIAALESASGQTLRSQRVAWYVDDGIAPVNEATRSAVMAAARALADAGMIVSEERPPGVERGQELWTKLFARAASLEMRREYLGREQEAGELVGYLLKTSAQTLPPSFDEYAEAWTERDRLRDALVAWMAHTPLLLAPVGATEAYEHGARRVEVAGRAISIFRAFSYAQTFNVFGLPAVSVPAGRTPEGLPVGVQLIGPPFAEAGVLRAARVIEESLGGWQMPSLAP